MSPEAARKETPLMLPLNPTPLSARTANWNALLLLGKNGVRIFTRFFLSGKSNGKCSATLPWGDRDHLRELPLAQFKIPPNDFPPSKSMRPRHSIFCWTTCGTEEGVRSPFPCSGQAGTGVILSPRSFPYPPDLLPRIVATETTHNRRENV